MYFSKLGSRSKQFSCRMWLTVASSRAYSRNQARSLLLSPFDTAVVQSAAPSIPKRREQTDFLASKSFPERGRGRETRDRSGDHFIAAKKRRKREGKSICEKCGRITRRDRLSDLFGEECDRSFRNGMDEHLTRDKFSYFFMHICSKSPFRMQLERRAHSKNGPSFHATSCWSHGIMKKERRTCLPPSLLRGGK